MGEAASDHGLNEDLAWRKLKVMLSHTEFFAHAHLCHDLHAKKTQKGLQKNSSKSFLQLDLVPRNSAARAGPNLRLVEIDGLADLGEYSFWTAQACKLYWKGRLGFRLGCFRRLSI